MAKKENFDFDNWDDFDDFDDFDSGSGMGDFKSTTKKGKAREAVASLSGGLVSGIKKQMFTRNIYQKMISSALPSEYSVAFDTALEAKDSVEEIYDAAVRESSDVNDKLARGVKPFVDKYNDKLPQRMRGPLRRWTSGVRPANEFTTENKEELESVAAINDIFNKRQQTKSIKNSSIQAQVQTGIAKGSLGLTTQLVELKRRQLAYQDQIDMTWKRKTLELQYKQFFVQRQTLDVSQQMLGLSKESYKSIIENSGLPDAVKLRKSELAGHMVKEKLYGKAIDGFSGMSSRVFSELSRNAVKKIRSGSKEFQQSLSEMLEELYDGVEMGSDMAETMGVRGSINQAGEMGSDYVTGKLIKYVGGKFKGKLEGNENVKKAADWLASANGRLPRIINQMAKSGDTGSGLLDMLLELTDASTVFGKNPNKIMGNHSAELDTHMYFDLLTKKSITEIIPGYLTRIHHEIRSLRTGDDSQPMLAFDFEKGLFSNEKRLNRRLKEKVVGSANTQALGNIHDDISKALKLNGTINAEGKQEGGLSKETRREFLKQFSMASIEGNDFSFKTLLDDNNNSLSFEQKEELREFFLDEFNLDIQDPSLSEGGMVARIREQLQNLSDMSPEAAKAQRALTEALDRQAVYLNNPVKTLLAAASRGGIKSALSTGIVSEEGGEYTVNYEKFIDALMNNKGKIKTDSSGDFKPPEEDKKQSKTDKFINDTTKSIKDKIKDKLPWNKNKDEESEDDITETQDDSLGTKKNLRQRIGGVKESTKARFKRVKDSEAAKKAQDKAREITDKVNENENVVKAKKKAKDTAEAVNQNETVVKAKQKTREQAKKIKEDERVQKAQKKAQSAKVKATEELDKVKAELKATEQKVKEAQTKAKQTVDDAKVEAKEIVVKAKQTAKDLQDADKRAEIKAKLKEDAKEKAQEAKVKARELKQKGQKTSVQLADDIKSGKTKEQLREATKSAQDKAVKVTRREIARFNKTFNAKRYEELKAKYAVDDKVKKVMDYAKEVTGRELPTQQDIVSLFNEDSKFRELVNDAKSAVDNKTSDKVKERYRKTRDKAKGYTSKVKLPTFSKNASGEEVKEGEPTEQDHIDAEDYADHFIEENNIVDETGKVKEGLISAWYRDRFRNSRGYVAKTKTVDALTAGANAARTGANRVRSVRGSGQVTEVMSLLFQMNKFALQAGEIATRPSRAALKMIPWGLKKIIGTFVETVNFHHVEHGLWLPGEKEPRLLKTGLMNGRYTNGKGEIVNKPKDLEGNIYDNMQTPAALVLTESEYRKGLYDSTGKLIYKAPSKLGKIRKAITSVPGKLIKGAGKLAKKAVLGYLNVTTKPVTWIINRIMREDRIEPKLHAELVQLGLTEQTNQKLDTLNENLQKQKEEEKPKFNDRDGSGKRDGWFGDIKAKHEERRQKRREAREEKKKARGDKKGLLSRLIGKKGSDDEEGSGLLGKASGLFGLGGRMAGGLGRVASNPYVLAGVAIASYLGFEVMRDGSKSKDADDIANIALPDSLKDNKAARIAVRIGEKVIDKVFLAHARGLAKIATKSVEWMSRLGKWGKRRAKRGFEDGKRLLAKIPGAAVGFLFGTKPKRFIDKLLGQDNVNPLFRFRMAQYGFDYNDTEAVRAVLKFEDDILSTLTEATETGPAKISDKVTIEQSAAYFGASINSEENLAEWIAWFSERFRPVFLSNVTMLKRMGFTGRNLHEVDSLMAKKEKLEFLSKINFFRQEFNPYDVSVSPIGTESKLEIVGLSKVDKIRKESQAEINVMPDDPKKLKAQQDRAKARDAKTLDKAKKTHENTKVDKRNDPYAKIDKMTFKNMVKAVKGKDKSVNDPKFSGAGAGTTTATKEKPKEKPIIDMDDKGVIGNAVSGIASGIGGLFIKKANASAFIPEAQLGGKAIGTVTGNGLAAISAPASTAPKDSIKTALTTPPSAPTQSVASKPTVNVTDGGLTHVNQAGAGTMMGAALSKATDDVSTTSKNTQHRGRALNVGFANALEGVAGKVQHTGLKLLSGQLGTILLGKFKPNMGDGARTYSSADKPLKAVDHARQIARDSSSGYATRNIKESLIRAGYQFKAPSAASDYPARALPEMGFVKIDLSSKYQVGDIIVFSSNKTYKNGHIQIYDGANWISDHVQKEIIPFTDNVPPYSLWRDMQFSTKGSIAENSREKRKEAETYAKKTTHDDKSKSKAGGGDAEKSKSPVEKAWDKIRELGSASWQKAKDTTGDIAASIKEALGGLAGGAANMLSGAGDAISNAVSGAGDAISNTLASMTGSQKEWQLRVYKAFKNAGFSEQHSRILTAEIGRENSYNPKYLFGGHADPHKGSNLGMLSWQGDRKPKLISFLRQAGVLDGANKMVAGQQALDAQARFIMWELKNTHSKVGSVFLSKPNISYQEGAYLIGKKYILWRIDDPKYAAKGKANRDGFYNMLLKQLGAKDGGAGAVPTATAAPAAAAPAPTTAPAQAAKDKVKSTAAPAAANTTAATAKDKKTKTTAATTAAAATAASTGTTPAAATAKATVAATATTAKDPNTDPKTQADSTPKATANTAMPAGAMPIKAAQIARRRGGSRSQGRCARYVREALQGAGYKFNGVPSAYMYANGTLSGAGFGQISTNTPWQIGDIVVINRFSGRPHGHICIWDGRNWISDFIQSNWNVYGGRTVSWTLWRDRRYLAGAQASSGPTSSGATGGNASVGGGDASGGAAAAPRPEYKTVKMKYNEYGKDFDAAIRKSFETGTKLEYQNANTPTKVDTAATTPAAQTKAAKEAVGATTTKDGKPLPTTPPKANPNTPAKPTVNGKEVKTPAATKEAPKSTTKTNTDTKVSKPALANSFVASSSTSPDLSFGKKFTTPSAFVEQEARKQQLIEERKSRNLTQRMSEQEAKRANEDMAQSAYTLKESLKVQQQMLATLNRMDEHLAAISKGQKQRQITESSSGNTDATKVEETSTTRRTHRVQRAGREVPMSMAKMI